MPADRHRWSRRVAETSNALDLDPGVFTWQDPQQIARAVETLPTALRGELRDALVRLDSERIAALLGQVGEVDRELGDTLLRLAKGFDYPAVLRLLDDVGEAGH